MQLGILRITNFNSLFFIFYLLCLMPKNQLIAKDLQQCRQINLADVGWTDISATTALASTLLEELGYQPKITLLSLSVTYSSLKNNDIDVFLGNWMPSSASEIEPYLKDGSLIQLIKNLQGARYTLAVPKYAFNHGVRNFSDLSRFKEKFDGKIYGLEPGNDGNNRLLNIISTNKFNLGSWFLVESSEQGMLAEVKRAVAAKQWIAFLGWAPHPMNNQISMEYLAGGDEYFGPDFGNASVYTVVRKNFINECPNATAFFKNLIFTIPIENRLMELILNDGHTPQKAAEIFLKENPNLKEQWLRGLLSFKKIKKEIETSQYLLDETRFKIPIGESAEQFFNFLTFHYSKQFNAISSATELLLQSITNSLKSIPHLWLIILCGFIVLAIHRSILLSIFVMLGFMTIFNLGYLDATIETLILVIFSTILSVIIGIPIGIVAARYKIIYEIMRPILDLMQTIPTFVYLIPTLMLFGLGMVPGLISTIIFAMPAPIRLTYLGITSTPKHLLEAGEAFGCTPMQQLIKLKLPYALPSIRAGVTQCIMLSLSMVVISALVGAQGLGIPVVRALNTVNIKQGIEAGIAIVILAIILDRTMRDIRSVATENREGAD